MGNVNDKEERIEENGGDGNGDESQESGESREALREPVVERRITRGQQRMIKAYQRNDQAQVGVGENPGVIERQIQQRGITDIQNSLQSLNSSVLTYLAQRSPDRQTGFKSIKLNVEIEYEEGPGIRYTVSDFMGRSPPPPHVVHENRPPPQLLRMDTIFENRTLRSARGSYSNEHSRVQSRSRSTQSCTEECLYGASGSENEMDGSQSPRRSSRKRKAPAKLL